MSFQAYIDNIKTKTGKSPADFRRLAGKQGLLEPGIKTKEIISWLKKDFGLGHGHAMAIVVTLQSAGRPALSVEEKVAKHFTGTKAGWRKTYDGFLAKIQKFGGDVSQAPTNSYISLLRQSKKFGIVQITSERLDVGIKLKGANPTRRFETAGRWNNMVTHRVRITESKQIDTEVLAWLKRAYEEAK